jgi:hypothetical protein
MVPETHDGKYKGDRGDHRGDKQSVSELNESSERPGDDKGDSEQRESGQRRNR